ncbi:MAG: heavy metal-binding domain-containing protein [Bacteroidia bacterium]
MKIILVLIVAAVIGLSTISCGNKEEKTLVDDPKEHLHKDADLHKLAYECPMNCEKGKVYEKQGNCPVCNMKLIKVSEENHEGHQHKAADHQGHEH